MPGLSLDQRLEETDLPLARRGSLVPPPSPVPALPSSRLVSLEELSCDGDDGDAFLSLDQRLEARNRHALASNPGLKTSHGPRLAHRHTSWTPALGESQALSHSLRTRTPSFFEHLVDSSERVAEATEALEGQNSSAVLKPRDAQLLRAVPAERVLRSSWTMRPRTLWFKPAAEGGPHPTLRYSRQVAGEVEFFISYCQKGSPRQSHIALLQYVNGRAAVIFSFVVAIAVLILQAAPLLSCGGAIGPLYNSPCVRDGIFGTTTRSCWVLHGPALGAQQIATVAFYLAFFFWHRIAPEQLCFFDKLTQAQHGPDRAKTQAMQQVFLRHSRRLCVLWSPGYFERLSTVFDLAAFVHFDGSSWERVDFLGVATNLVVPVGQALSALAGWALYDAFAKWGVSAEIMSYFGEEEHFGTTYMLIGFGVAPLISLFMIYIQLDLDDMHRRVSELSSFKLATCERENTPEARRHDEQVMGQIAAWFAREEEVLGEDLSNASAAKVSASTDLGVQNFEHHIQTVLREEVMRKLFPSGTSLIPFQMQVLWSLPSLWRALDWVAAYLVLGNTGSGTDAPGSPVLFQYWLFALGIGYVAQPLGFLAIKVAVSICGVTKTASWGRWLVGLLLTMALIGMSYGGWARVTLHPGACSSTRCEPWYWVVLACYCVLPGLYCLWNWGVFRRLAVRSARDLKRRSAVIPAMAKVRR